MNPLYDKLTEKEEKIMLLIIKYNLINYVTSIILKNNKSWNYELNLPEPLIKEFEAQYWTEDIWEQLSSALNKMFQTFWYISK